jgi:hypothetical protein
MWSRRRSRLAAQLGVPLLAIGMVAMAVGTVAAHTGAPKTIVISHTGARSIDASGTWHWGGLASASMLSYVGYAIDWGDVSTGNDVGTHHIGDGTPATNLVLQPTSPAQGSDGSWGPVSHTYAKAGTYTVCVIIYDLGKTKPFATTGYHSLQAGGVGHNTDNSVDKGSAVPADCATFAVTDPSPSAIPSASPVQSFASAAPSASPVQSVGGATSDPTNTPFETVAGETAAGQSATPPPTSTGRDAPGNNSTPIAALLIGLAFATIGLASVEVQRRKVRR